MIPFEEMKRRLQALGKDREWLVEKTGYSPSTVKQYLGPSGKRTDDFLKEVSKAILDEEKRQKAEKPDQPQWNLIFLTEDEFDRADRASRLAGAESLKEFCRVTILAKADDILAKKKRGKYPELKEVRAAKVADQDQG